jgi:hypothetical protein
VSCKSAGHVHKPYSNDCNHRVPAPQQQVHQEGSQERFSDWCRPDVAGRPDNMSHHICSMLARRQNHYSVMRQRRSDESMVRLGRQGERCRTQCHRPVPRYASLVRVNYTARCKAGAVAIGLPRRKSMYVPVYPFPHNPQPATDTRRQHMSMGGGVSSASAR